MGALVLQRVERKSASVTGRDGACHHLRDVLEVVKLQLAGPRQVVLCHLALIDCLNSDQVLQRDVVFLASSKAQSKTVGACVEALPGRLPAGTRNWGRRIGLLENLSRTT